LPRNANAAEQVSAAFEDCSATETSMRAVELITGTVRQENSVRAIRFGISGLGGFQGVLVGGRGLDRKTENKGTRERGSKGTRG
jgi:hypothetical protein